MTETIDTTDVAEKTDADVIRAALTDPIVDAALHAAYSIGKENGVKAERERPRYSTSKQVASPAVSVIVNRPTVVAHAVLKVKMPDGGTDEIIGVGTATCAPCDHWSESVGKTLACSRALLAVAERMLDAGLNNANLCHRERS